MNCTFYIYEEIILGLLAINHVCFTLTVPYFFGLMVEGSWFKVYGSIGFICSAKFFLPQRTKRSTKENTKFKIHG
jgi:hypothetical protein